MSPFHVLFYWLIAVGISLRKKRPRKRIPRCMSMRHGLDFEFDKFPRRYQLPFCQKYKKSCCKPSDTHRIFNEIQSLLQNDNISAKCKQMTTDIWCSSCNPDIGVQRMIGICVDYCNEWYQECQNEYYYLDILDKPRACTQKSAVCSPLNSFIANGTDFCTSSGFDVNHIYLHCFDGQKRDHYNMINTNIKMLTSKQTIIENDDEKKQKKRRDDKKLKKEREKRKKLREKKKKNKNKNKKKKKKKQPNDKKTKKKQQLKSLKKKLRQNKQSPVPWLEDTISESSAKMEKQEDKKVKKRKKQTKPNLNNKNLYD